jgi:hypothetical protein
MAKVVMRFIFFLILIWSVFAGSAKDRWKEIKSIRLIRLDDLVHMVDMKKVPFCNDFENSSMKQWYDTVEITNVEQQKKLASQIRRSAPYGGDKSDGKKIPAMAKAYISYASGEMDVACFTIFTSFFLNGEERVLEDTLDNLVFHEIPRSKQLRVRAHAGSEAHECLLDTGTVKRCSEDSLYHIYYNSLKVNVFGVPDDSITLQSDSADIVKRLFGVYMIKEKGRQDSIAFRVYVGRRLVDSFTKFVAKANPVPYLSVCRKRHGPCHVLTIKKIYTEDPYHPRVDFGGVSFEVMSFVAEIYESGKLTYSEYITGDSFTDSFKSRYDKVIRKPENKLVLRAIVMKDDKGNILIGAAEYFMNWL